MGGYLLDDSADQAQGVGGSAAVYSLLGSVQQADAMQDEALEVVGGCVVDHWTKSRGASKNGARLLLRANAQL